LTRALPADPGSGAAQALTTTMDPRCDHGTVQGLDRLPHGWLAYVAVCRPREDQVLILGGLAGQAWAGRKGGWEPADPARRVEQLQSQSWRPGLSAGLRARSPGPRGCGKSITRP